jgi:FlaA1/EpsC-like NDP-sugar epimerase
VLRACRLIALLATRLHHWSFFMSGLSEGLRLVVAMSAGTAAAMAACAAFLPLGLPRSVWALEFFVATSLAAVMRFGPRAAWVWWGDLVRSRAGATRTIIVGVGGGRRILARDVCRSKESPYHLLGFVDEHRHAAASASPAGPSGRPGPAPRAHPPLRREHRAPGGPVISAQTVRQVLDMCDRLRVRFKIVPTSFTVVDRRLTSAMLHDLSPSDLLPRQEVAFEEREIRALVEGRCALVTGAGGSIGAEACRQLAATARGHW